MFRAWGGTEGCRVVVRAKDTWNYTRWSIGAFKNSKHSLMVVKKGAVTLRGPSPAGSIEQRKWHALKVDVKGKTVTCSIDGKVTNQGDLAANAKGTVGLGTCNTQAEFKNLRVTSPDGKILLEALAPPRLLALGQMRHHVLPLVPLAALDDGLVPKGALDRRPQALAAVDDYQDALVDP